MVSMKKLKKNEIAHTVIEAIGGALEKLKIAKPSKKTEKMVDKVSKKISSQLEKEVKKQDKKVVLAVKKVEKDKLALEKKAKVKK
ncbi:hypothetical protein B0E43_17545 [Algoriphagus sp. A40]|nr:hypothetical protein B0E43_17545 [Algoriphagus sp. A40]